jgi:hypothetical protein
MLRVRNLALPCCLALASSACSGSPEPLAFQNQVFYYDADSSSGGDLSAFEQRYPPLDLAQKDPNPAYLGVGIIGGSIHLSRPVDWRIIKASNKPEERYIKYVSPEEYVFAVYEQVDSPSDTWRDVMQRYEDSAASNGAELLGQRVPMSTWNAQGRAYAVRRRVKAAKGPFVTMSNEFLVRDDHRVILVQVVHQGDNLKPLSEELLRVVQTLEVL